jgi:hypothetical protein
MSIFTKEQQDEKVQLQQQLADCTDEAQAQEVMKKLLDLNRKKQETEKNRPILIDAVFKQVKELEIEFKDFMEKSVFSLDVVKAYAIEQGFVKAVPAKGAKGTAKKKAPVIIGTFNFSDYGFTMPNKKDKNVPMGDGETSLVWDFHKRYGGLSWEQKFINAILEKGYEHVVSVASKEFQDWVETSVEGGGPKIGKQIFKNKREFLSAFDIKPAQADEITFTFPERKVEETVVVKDEHSQETPADAEVQAPAKKKRH